MTGPTLDFLTVDDLLAIAEGILPSVAVRDVGLLASAADRPHAAAFGHEAYPSFAEKAAALLHSLARNHALVDGNKRLAWAAARTFSLLNGRDIALAVDDAEALIVGAADGTLDLSALANRLAAAGLAK